MSEAQDIADCVTAWLAYKHKVGLADLLNESSMAVPIAEYLAARHGTQIKSEVAHPLFEAKKKGRPRQIDFVRYKSNNTAWHAAFETKFETTDLYKIAGDLCRLVCLAQAKNVGNPARYFVYSAKTTKGKAFLGSSFNDASGRKSYFDGVLSRDVQELGKPLAVRINGLHDKQRKPFRLFAREYKTKIPSTFKINLKGWTEFGGFTCAVWQVLAARGSTLISAEEMMS